MNGRISQSPNRPVNTATPISHGNQDAGPDTSADTDASANPAKSANPTPAPTPAPASTPTPAPTPAPTPTPATTPTPKRACVEKKNETAAGRAFSFFLNPPVSIGRKDFVNNY